VGVKEEGDTFKASEEPPVKVPMGKSSFSSSSSSTSSIISFSFSFFFLFFCFPFPSSPFFI
jgi:hypothetical protein